MANLKATAIGVRLREVIEDSLGTLRTTPALRFSGDIPEGLTDDEQARRGLTAPRVRVHWGIGARSPSSPPINGNLIIYLMTAKITVVRTVSRDEQVDDDASDVLAASAMTDMDILRQALEYPGNLTATLAGATTDIVSGMLSWVGWEFTSRRGSLNSGAQVLEATHTFTGQVIARPAVA
jgi:hypothetical protein